MHWAMGEHEMARRANAVPFAIAAAQAEPSEPGCGRVAQRDRMLESTRVFEGRDLTTLSSPFNSINGGANGYGPGATATYATTPVNIPPIKSEHSFSAYEEGDDEEGEEDDEVEAPRVRRRRRGAQTRLPGVAELEGEMAAFAARGEGRMAMMEAGEESGKRRDSA